jgi:CheY-like chemotaxis protein
MIDADIPELVHRVWSEYRDLPGLRLTLPQMQRLLDVPEDVCRRVVAALWMTGHVDFREEQVVGGLPRAPGDPGAPGQPRPDRWERGVVNVLVIEDDPLQLQGVAAGLRAAGFNVLAAGDAGYGTAVALLKPDVLVLDIGLPDGDGYGIARCVRSDPATAGIPILFLSARNGAADRARAAAVGAAGYIVKPCRTQALVEAIRAALPRSRR